MVSSSRRFIDLVIGAVLLVGAAWSASCASDADQHRWDEEVKALRDREKRAADNANDDNFLRSTRYTPIRHAEADTLNESLDLDEAHFDLALALFQFAREYGNSELDIAAELKRIDQMILDLRSRVNAGASQEYKLSALKGYLHYREGFQFDYHDPKGRKSENLFFDQVMKRRKGYCVTLSALYLVLARGIDLNLRACRMPGHFAVLAPKDGGGWEYIETTDQGTPRERIDLEIRFRVSSATVEDYGVYLTPTSDKAVISAMFNNLGALALLEGELESSQRYFDRSTAISPDNLDARFNRTSILLRSENEGDIHFILKELKAILRVDPNFYPAYCRRATVYYRFGDRDQAMRDVAKAKRMRPDLPMAYIEEGAIALSEKQYDLARKSFLIALEKDATSVDALKHLVRLEQITGNVEAANTYQDKLKSLLPNGVGD